MTAPTTTEKPAKVTAGDVQRFLRARYAAPEWAYFAEVRDATGAGAARSADGLAMNCYPSKGLAVHGFEVKVSRGDWLRELEQPGKAAAIARYCDHWWIVAPPGVVRAGELPASWGLLLVKHPDSSWVADALRCEVKAPKLDAVAMDRPFLASLLRSAAVASPALEEMARVRAEGRTEGVRVGEATASGAVRRIAELTATIAKFEEAAGVRLEGYNGPDLAAAYKLLSHRKYENERARLAYIAQEAESIARSAREAVVAIDALPPAAA